MTKGHTFRRAVTALVAALNVLYPLMPAPVTVLAAPPGLASARVEITQAGTNVQIYQPSLSLVSGQQYRLTFDAYSSTGRDMSMHVHQHGEPYTTYGLADYQVDLTTSWQTFTTTFTASGFTGTVSDARLRFWFAPYAQAGDVYWVDNVVLEPTSGGPNILQNSTFDAATAPWVFFTDGAGAFTSASDSPPTPPDEPTGDVPGPGPNTLTNGDFESGTAGWKFYTGGRGAFGLTSVNAYEGVNSGRVDISLEGSDSQLYQEGHSLTSGQTYTVSFAARSTTGRDLSVVVEQSAPPYANYGLSPKQFNLTSGWQEFSITFTASATASDAKLKFWFAPHAVQGDTYFIDAVSFQTGGTDVSDTEGPAVSIQVQDSQTPPVGAAGLPKFKAAITPISPSSLADVWAVDDGERVKQDDLNHWAKTSPQNRVWDGNRVSIFGGRNETVAFQLQLQAAASGASNMNVRLPSLTNGSYTIQNTSTDPTQYVGRNIEIFLEHYYDTSDSLQRSVFTNPSAGGWGVCEAIPMPDSAYIGLIPDMLVPIEAPPGQKGHGQGGAPFQIAGSRNQGVWFDVYVPKNAPAGTYTGNIEILENSTVTYRIPVSFQVYNFQLSDENHTNTFFAYPYNLLERHPGIAYNTPAFWELNHKYMNLAHRHRLDLVLAKPMSLNDFSANLAGYYKDGAGSYFTSAYGYDGPGVGVGQDTYAIGMYNQPQYRYPSDYPIVEKRNQPKEPPDCPTFVDGYSETGFYPRTQSAWQTAADQWEGWFQSNAPEVVRYKYMTDEPGRSENACENIDIREKAEWIHTSPGVGKYLRTYVTVPYYNGTILQWGSIDFYSTTMTPDLYNSYHLYERQPPEYHGNAYRIQSQETTVPYQGRKKMTGIYNTYLPHYGDLSNLDVPLADARAIPWVVRKYKVDQYFLWDVAYLTESDPGGGSYNVWQRLHYSNEVPGGDGMQILSGRDDVVPSEDRGVNGPIISMRLKNFRRGMQDAEYLWLAQQGNKDVQAILNGVVPGAFDDFTPAASYTAPFNTVSGNQTGNQLLKPECRKNYTSIQPGATIQYTDHRRPPTWPQTGYGFENARLQLAALLDGSAPPPPPPAAQCGDGTDNDADGLTDMVDPGCANTADNDENDSAPPPPPPPPTGAEATLNIAQVTDNTQLYQPNFSLTSGQQYRLTFDAYSSTGHDVSVHVHQHGTPYTSYGLSNYQVDLGTSYQTYTTTFTASGFTGTVADARIRFWLTSYAQAGDVYHFDNIRLESIAGGSNLLQNGTFDSGLPPWVFYNQGSAPPPVANLYATFTVTATDPSGISEIQLFVNGTLVRTCTSSPCAYTSGPHAVGASLTYYATASDTSALHNQSRYPATGELTHVVRGAADTTPPAVSVTHQITSGGGGTPVQCGDGTDNDSDGLIDLSDPGCTSSTDVDESNTAPPPSSVAGGIKALIIGNYPWSQAMYDKLYQMVPTLSSTYGVNTLVLMLNYRFEFQDQPGKPTAHLQGSGPFKRAWASELKARADQYGIRLIPYMNLLGHQTSGVNVFSLLREYPSFQMAPNDYAASLNPNAVVQANETGPGKYPAGTSVRTIVADLMDDMTAAFGADALHTGLDEVLETDAASFSAWADFLRDHLAAQGKQMWMWGDRLLPGGTSCSAWYDGYFESASNGTAAAIETLSPENIVITDWHYETSTDGWYSCNNGTTPRHPGEYPSLNPARPNSLVSKGFASVITTSDEIGAAQETAYYLFDHIGDGQPSTPRLSPYTKGVATVFWTDQLEFLNCLENAAACASSAVLNYINAFKWQMLNYQPPVIVTSSSPAPAAVPPTTFSIAAEPGDAYVTFTAAASDASGIASMAIYVNNVNVKTCTSSPCAYSGGPYADLATTTYYATATDTAGNVGRDPASGQKTLTGTVVGADSGNPMTQEEYDAFVDSQEVLLSTTDGGLIDRVSGYILLQVQSHGEAWYVDPVSRLRYYLPNGDYAFEALQTFGLGITNADIAQIPIGFVPGAGGTDSDLDTVPDRVETAIGTNPQSSDSDGDGYSDNVEIISGYDPLGPNQLTFNQTLVGQVRGRILLQVQARGEAWYLYPADGKRYYMADGVDAYQVMRYLSLGISNADLTHIPIGRLTLGTNPPAASACGDGVDNDSDSLIDMSDPGCTSSTDTNETNGAGSTVGSRGRPRIVNNNVVADNGYPLRGEHVLVTKWNMGRVRSDQLWLDLRDKYHLNTARLLAYQHEVVSCNPPLDDPANPENCLPVAEIIPMLQEAVAMAVKHGMYVMIDYHSLGPNYSRTHALDWWSQIAPLFKDNRNVIYQTQNEPIEWTSSDYTQAEVDFQGQIYQHIRALAPDTMILAWNIAAMGPTENVNVMKDLVDRNNSISYTNAAVAWHGYSDLIPSRVEKPLRLREYYPVIMNEMERTPNEFGSADYWTNVGILNQDIGILEQNGFSWVLLAAYPKAEGQQDYIHDVTISWPADPGAVTQ